MSGTFWLTQEQFNNQSTPSEQAAGGCRALMTAKCCQGSFSVCNAATAGAMFRQNTAKPRRFAIDMSAEPRPGFSSEYSRRWRGITPISGHSCRMRPTARHTGSRPTVKKTATGPQPD